MIGPFGRDRASLHRIARLAALALIAMAVLLGHARPGKAEPPQLNGIRSWAYQLQNVDPRQVRASPYDLVVIDYGFIKSSAATLPREVIDFMRDKPNGERRLVFAYLSIGEAEQYRYYWDERWLNAPPEWLEIENAQWPGNFLVKYWHPDWQALIHGSPSAYLDRIIDAGFDGVYLDGVDKFEHWRDKRPSAAEDMVGLIVKLGAYARAKRPGFQVIPQNGDNLLYDPRLLKAIDGISREDLFYNETSQGDRNGPTSITESINRLRLVQAAGKPVLVVEYPGSRELALSVLSEIEKLGFIGYIAARELNSLFSPLFGRSDKAPAWNPSGSQAAPYIADDAGARH